MATSTTLKTSAKPNLDIARAIATLQEQVNENARAIKQVLSREKAQISNNTVLSIVFVILVAMIGWVKMDQNELKQELSNTRQELSSKIDSNYKELSSKIDSNYKELSSKIDVNHKQIINILLKRK